MSSSNPGLPTANACFILERLSLSEKILREKKVTRHFLLNYENILIDLHRMRVRSRGTKTQLGTSCDDVLVTMASAGKVRERVEKAVTCSKLLSAAVCKDMSAVVVALVAVGYYY